MDQQLSHTKYLDNLQGEWIKDTRILQMFHGALPNLIKIRRLQLKKVGVHQGDNRPLISAA